MCVPRDFYERNCWIPCLIRVASALDEHRRHNVVAAADILQDLVEQVAFADARGLPVPEVMVGVANWLAGSIGSSTVKASHSWLFDRAVIGKGLLHGPQAARSPLGVACLGWSAGYGAADTVHRVRRPITPAWLAPCR
jgi:hypothetical protein